MLLKEQVRSSTLQKFFKWLKQNDIDFETSGNRDSIYYHCIFDNGTEDPILLKIRFSNHKAGYRGYTVDIDTFEDDIRTFDDIVKALESYGIVVERGKYLGTRYADTIDMEKGSDTYAQSKKYDIPIKRGKASWQ